MPFEAVYHQSAVNPVQQLLQRLQQEESQGHYWHEEQKGHYDPDSVGSSSINSCSDSWWGGCCEAPSSSDSMQQPAQKPAQQQCDAESVSAPLIKLPDVVLTIIWAKLEGAGRVSLYRTCR